MRNSNINHRFQIFKYHFDYQPQKVWSSVGEGTCHGQRKLIFFSKHYLYDYQNFNQLTLKIAAFTLWSTFCEPLSVDYMEMLLKESKAAATQFTQQAMSWI